MSVSPGRLLTLLGRMAWLVKHVLNAENPMSSGCGYGEIAGPARLAQSDSTMSAQLMVRATIVEHPAT